MATCKAELNENEHSNGAQGMCDGGKSLKVVSSGRFWQWQHHLFCFLPERQSANSDAGQRQTQFISSKYFSGVSF